MAMNHKMSLAGIGTGSGGRIGNRNVGNRNDTLIYGGVALGVLAGAALSTYVWRTRVKAALDANPLEQADKLIDACEKKLERIEKLMRDIQDK